MKITLLCTDAAHPVNTWLRSWIDSNGKHHHIQLCRDKSELPGGDILFLISCSQLIESALRSRYRHTLVLHASDLPRGRGWSPHIWSLLEGSEDITVTLLEAEDGVDTGAIWAQERVRIPIDAVHDEVNQLLFDAELRLMDEGMKCIARGDNPCPQDSDVEPTYYRKRRPEDSEIDPGLPLVELFNTIRLMDPIRYPAYFRLHGHVYTLEIKKVGKDETDND